MPENAASTNESLLSATLNKIPEKILLLDESGDIIFANKAWDALLGFARRQQRRVPNNGIRAALTALSPA
ncbi:PAS domain-containing protein, partial [Klebsiella michiganensis]|uniref:PAS domain-containing protein n=1 Tax=Klebsiella michiganensis TaxID=1134687 RepID=UPI001953B10D